jgi:hypothetical protein
MRRPFGTPFFFLIGFLLLAFGFWLVAGGWWLVAVI